MICYLYVVECSDQCSDGRGSLYTGQTKNLKQRIWDHNNSKRGAKYTRSRRPVTLLASWSYPNRSAAMKAERAFKKLSRKEKFARIRGTK